MTPARIEDYALLGDLETAALLSRDGSIDWMCVPRFDSGACFAALLGGAEHGRFRIAPAGEILDTRRAYRDDTMIVETRFRTAEGEVTLIDFMPPRDGLPNLVRIVEGRSGRVPMRLELVIRPDYGSVVPWVRKLHGRLLAIAGPDAIVLDSPVETRGQDLTTVADFTVAAGERVPFCLGHGPAHRPLPAPLDPFAALEATVRYWRDWVGRCTVTGPYREAVVRSLLTLKAMIFEPTGGIVAAPTTSLPERIGGTRNWDYRFCWLRDATFTLLALVVAGYRDEAAAWRDWLLRAAAGAPSQLQIMYGPAGERRLTELEIPWLPGYEGSRPVRIGNGAHAQRQLDVYGEVMDAILQATRAGMPPSVDGWQLQTALCRTIETTWREPDDGVWEMRSGRRHFTHSKVMAWVAFDRAIKMVEEHGLSGPLDRWRALRAEIHADVCRNGVDPATGAFVQSYGSREPDASLLVIPLVGFLPADDPRVAATLASVERHLMHDGLVRRYRTERSNDGLPPGEGTFLMCTFWLADNLVVCGRRAEAAALFERLLSLRNDVGLLSEQYDPVARRLLGNFPQAFSHVALVTTACYLADQHEVAHRHE